MFRRRNTLFLLHRRVMASWDDRIENLESVGLGSVVLAPDVEHEDTGNEQ